MVNAPKSLTRSLGCLGVIFTLASIGQMVSYAGYPGENVEGAVFSPDGKILYGIGGDYTPNHWGGVLTAWNTETGQRLWRQELRDNLNNNDALSLSKDGKTILLNRHQYLAFFDTGTGRLMRKRALQSNSYSLVISAQFIHDDREILVNIDDRRLSVLDTKTGQFRRCLRYPASEFPHNFAVSLDQKQVVLFLGNQLVLRELATDKTLAKQTVEESYSVAHFHFLPDGKRFQFGENVWTPGRAGLVSNLNTNAIESPDGTQDVLLEYRGKKNERYPLGTVRSQGRIVRLEGQTGW